MATKTALSSNWLRTLLPGDYEGNLIFIPELSAVVLLTQLLKALNDLPKLLRIAIGILGKFLFLDNDH